MPKRTDVERELEERATEERRQGSGSTPTEDVLERALEVEAGVEWHAGEDAGEVPERGDEGELPETGANPREGAAAPSHGANPT